MPNIFLAPHNDDEALFGSYIIQRTKPIVYVCYDGAQHARKFNVTIEQRRDESRRACKIMGVEVQFLGLSDEEDNRQKLRLAFMQLELLQTYNKGLVFAPARNNANKQHDLVSELAEDIFPSAMFYGNYTKDRLYPDGEMPLTPSPEEKTIKEQALACYESQLKINGHHFTAVKNVPEYLSFKAC